MSDTLNFLVLWSIEAYQKGVRRGARDRNIP